MNKHAHDMDRTPNAKPVAAQTAERTVKNQFAANHLVDETGAYITLPDQEAPAQAHGGEPSVGATGPTNWWRRGLLLIATLIALVIILQVVTGGGVTPTP